MKKIVFIFAVLILVSVGSNVYSQVVLDTGKVKLIITPGETANGELMLSNDSDEDIPLKAYFEDFIYLPPYDARKKFLPAGSTDYSFNQWVFFSPQEFIVPAHGKKELSYVIKPPRNVSGGYYGVLFFERDRDVDDSQQKGIKIITRIGCLFFLETDDKYKKAVLEDLSTQNNTISGYLVNTGNVILIANSVFYVMDEEGMVADRNKLKTLYLPPGKKAFMEIADLDKLSSGRYTMVLTFDLGEGDVFVKEIDFVKESFGGLKIIETRD